MKILVGEFYEFLFGASERKYLLWENHIGNDRVKGKYNDNIF